MVRRSQELGRFVTEANLGLLDAASQFLGGLKLAVSQNLQGAFTAEFRETLAGVARRQVDNVRERTYRAPDDQPAVVRCGRRPSC